MKMIGICAACADRCFCRSSPLRSGRLTSRTRQLGACSRVWVKKSPADLNRRARQPADCTNNSSDSRTEISSSTMYTTGSDACIGADFHNLPDMTATPMIYLLWDLRHVRETN